MPETESIFEFEPRKTIKGYPELHWTGKRPYRSTQYFPAQIRESYGEPVDGWMNKIFWGDNLQVMSHLLKEFRGKVDLIYIDPPFDSKADYKKTIELRGLGKAESDSSSFEEKQYGDIWTNDEYLQFMYERLVLMRELLSQFGSIYLHCDWHKSGYLRCLMDEVFGVEHFRNEIIWHYSGWNKKLKSSFEKRHDSIFFYSFDEKGEVFSSYAEPYASKKAYLAKRKQRVYIDEEGREYTLDTRDDGKRQVRVYIEDSLARGRIVDNVWDIDKVNNSALESMGYPTQKPESLIERIVSASSKSGSIVLDCFMGSGTTQAVAMKLGRRFIGADINLGAIQTTTKRLISIADDINLKLQEDKYYTGFEVYNVNNYDFFRNPIEAKDLLIEALEIQKFNSGSIYDGELDGRMVKIMPVNRIATKADLSDMVANLPYKAFEKRKEVNPASPVERFTLVCMGHEPDLKASLKQELAEYIIDVEIVDILRDKSELQLKREAEAEAVIEGENIVIRSFYPLNLMQKLSLQRELVEDWRQLVESIMIDWNFDGVVMQPSVMDIPSKNELVKGIYKVPHDAGTIKIKITDLLSESLEVEVS